MIIAVLLLAATPLISGVADHDEPNKFHDCTLCNECFVDYHDYDVWQPKKPFLMAKDGYGTGLDSCLAECMRYGRCSAAVYGMIGGREVYTCELYEDVNPTTGLTYTPFVNTYFKRKAMPCMVAFGKIPRPTMIPGNDEPEKRKERYRELFSKPNPFAWGRRRR